jgi:hypothetical protein
MEWLGMDEATILRIVLEAMRELDLTVIEEEREKIEISFEPRELPRNLNIKHWLEGGLQDENLNSVIEYIRSRGFTLDDFDWRWSDEEGYQRRVIMPYKWKGQEVGFTARHIDVTHGRTKYVQHIGSDYVFGLDHQHRDAKFSLLLEGPFDAIATGGCAVLTNEVSERKAELIDSLAREIIVVPDMEKSGGPLIDAALKYKWSVAFPEWQEDIKDGADAVRRYGKLYTMRSILASKVSNSLKIELLRKRHGI